MSIADPQNDIPCRDCKRPTQHDTERCDDCRKLADVVACFDEENPGLYSPALGVYHLPDHGGILTLFADRWVAESDPESDEQPWESLSAFVEASDDYRKSRALRAERDTLAAEVKRLREELKKPVGEIERLHNARMVANVIAGEAANALREIGALAGVPSTVDVLLHLPDLVDWVRATAEHAETVRVVTADRDAPLRQVETLTAERAALLARVGANVPAKVER